MNFKDEKTIYECKLKGILKKRNKKDNCIPGDIVEFNEDEKIIIKITERNNILQRPLVANIDYLGIVFAAKNPNFDINRFNLILLNCFFSNIKPFVVINKIDLLSKDEKENLIKQFDFLKILKIDIFYISAKNELEVIPIQDYIKEKVTAFGGPSGAGKSSIINKLQNEKIVETGETSKKTSRGKHTTKGTTLLHLDCGGYIIDTPGFSSLEIPDIKDEATLQELFPEFDEAKSYCKFNNCIHIKEPGCNVKTEINNNNISDIRYNFYKKVYEILKNERWNKYD